MIFDGTTNGIVITIASIAAMAFVFLLAYIAQAIAKKGEITITLRRMAFINPYEVRLVVQASSTMLSMTEYHDVFLAAKVDGVLLPITQVAALPITQSNSTRFVLRSEKGYGFKVGGGRPFEGVFEFLIPEENDLSRFQSVYLVATDSKGVKKKAEFVLSSTAKQTVHFKNTPR